MKDIVSIESFKLNREGDIVVTAIVEDVVCVLAGSHLDPPEYAPGYCTITVPAMDLPPICLTDLNEEDLEEVVNRYANLNAYEWKPMIMDHSDQEV
jgi:hypothetical protein